VSGKHGRPAAAGEQIRVLLADDHAMVRQALAQVLADSASIRVAGQAGDGPETLRLAELLRPDVVVLDYGMPGRDAPSLIDSLRRALPDTRILILTVHEDIHYALRALEAGAGGYVVKSAAVEDLVQAIETVQKGGVWVSPRVSEAVFRRVRGTAPPKAGLDLLSPREFELLRALGSGMGLQECARHLGIGTSTASTYRSRLMEKLGLRTTADIIRFALEHRVVD
jgi:DNA-binding NarL/FixJ family response regulator